MSWAGRVEELRQQVEDRIGRYLDDSAWRVRLSYIEHQRTAGGSQPEVRGHHRSVACLDIGRDDPMVIAATGKQVGVEVYRRAASWLCDLDADRVNGWFRQTTVHPGIEKVVLEDVVADFGTLAIGSREPVRAGERPWLHVLEVAVERIEEAIWLSGEWGANRPLWRVRMTCLARRGPEGGETVPAQVNGHMVESNPGNEQRDVRDR